MWFAVGGTLVNITGDNFVNSSNLFCRWHDTQVVATFVSSSIVYCVAPSHKPPKDTRKPVVIVTNNNQDFTTDYVYYSYQGTVMSIAIQSSLSSCCKCTCRCDRRCLVPSDAWPHLWRYHGHCGRCGVSRRLRLSVRRAHIDRSHDHRQQPDHLPHTGAGGRGGVARGDHELAGLHASGAAVHLLQYALVACSL